MVSGILVAPELAKPSLRALWDRERGRLCGRYGFGNAFNLDEDWYDPDVLGIDLGMMLLAVENRRTGLIWRLMSSSPVVKMGLAAAGFRRAAAPGYPPRSVSPKSSRRRCQWRSAASRS